jgi:hypothetical protein
MVGCKDCIETVADYSVDEIKDDEICLNCNGILLEVKKEQERKTSEK